MEVNVKSMILIGKSLARGECSFQQEILPFFFPISISYNLTHMFSDFCVQKASKIRRVMKTLNTFKEIMILINF